MFNLLASTAARRSASSILSKTSTTTSSFLNASKTTTTLPQSSFFAATSSRLFSDEAAEKMKGSVKWFDAKKGFGFLVPDDGSPDVFVHHSSIHASGFRSLGEGEAVEFEVITEPNGKSKAIHVTGPNGDYVQGAPRREYNDGGYGMSFFNIVTLCLVFGFNI